MKARILATAVLLTVLAGCGGSTSNTAAKPTSDFPTSIPSPSVSTTTPAPAPTPMTIAQAAATYKAIVRKSADPVKTLNHYYITQDGRNLTRLKSMAKKLGASNWTFAKSMQATEWPAKVAKKAQAVTDAVVAEQGDITTLMRSRNYYQWQVNWQKMTSRSSKPFDSFRLALGLPPS